MSNKIQCLNLVHCPESTEILQLDAKLNSTYIRIPLDTDYYVYKEYENYD